MCMLHGDLFIYIYELWPLLASLFRALCSGGTCPKSRRTRLRNS